MSAERPGSADRPARKVFFREAIRDVVGDAMARDPRVLVLGQDVGAHGGAYQEFAGLYARFGPDRVRDTPVSENAMVGCAVGAAAAGLRPLVAITYLDFLLLGLDPLVNYGAKLRFKTGGRLRAPVVVKATAGARGQGVAHSQCLEAWLLGVPGLTVVAPSTPADAAGLLATALRADGPVVFVDHKRLFPLAGEVPAGEAPVPFGVAAVRRAGADVTLCAHSFQVRTALEAAAALEADGVSAEVIDLRSLAPLDVDTVASSVARTGALVTVEEGQPTCGVGVEVAARVREALGREVRSARVGALRAPVSSNPVLEAACLPSAPRITQAVRALLDPRRTP